MKFFKWIFEAAANSFSLSGANVLLFNTIILMVSPSFQTKLSFCPPPTFLPNICLSVGLTADSQNINFDLYIPCLQVDFIF